MGFQTESGGQWLEASLEERFRKTTWELTVERVDLGCGNCVTTSETVALLSVTVEHESSPKYTAPVARPLPFLREL